MAIIRRSDSGLGPHRAPTIRQPVSRLFLHHTVTPEWTGRDAARKLQDIARSRGFNDISYSWLLDVDGNEIEGRGWGRQGAHTAGFNSSSHAICLIGNFQSKTPPTAMLAAAARLVRKHGDGHGPGRITHGHRDVASTSCPGSRAYAKIGEINQLAATPEPPDLEATMFCKLGDTGSAVGVLQLKLRALGLYDGDIDSDYGNATAAAVLAARRRMGSTATSGDVFGHYAFWQVEQQVIAYVSDKPKLDQTFDRTSNQNKRIQLLERRHYPDGTDNQQPHVGLPA